MKNYFSLFGLRKTVDFKTKSQNVTIKWVKSLILNDLAPKGGILLNR